MMGTKHDNVLTEVANEETKEKLSGIFETSNSSPNLHDIKWMKKYSGSA